MLNVYIIFHHKCYHGISCRRRGDNFRVEQNISILTFRFLASDLAVVFLYYSSYLKETYMTCMIVIDKHFFHFSLKSCWNMVFLILWFDMIAIHIILQRSSRLCFLFVKSIGQSSKLNTKDIVRDWYFSNLKIASK